MYCIRFPAVLALAAHACAAHATNGMNIEGFGPVAAAMGGASFAHDNGTAAMMNNPATLGLAADGDRVDLALGYLGPRVSVAGQQHSDGEAYFMPAAGWTRHTGRYTYGLGVYAQGGMGTEYARGVDGLPERSELGVGRLIAPLVMNVDQKLTVGATLELVWAMLDLRMAMPITDMAGLVVEPGNGTLTGALSGLAGAGYDHARLDFSDNNDFSGKSRGWGLAGKLGFVYRLSPQWTLGGSYHGTTRLSDLETSAATMLVTDTGGNPAQSVPGKIAVRNFQWPRTYGLGLAWQASPNWLFAADWKRLDWAANMQSFTMRYSAMGDSVAFSLPQAWRNQNVTQLGATWRATPALSLRAGVNLASNPVPDATMHYLFPAIVENHVTAGLGYRFASEAEFNISFQHAPEVRQTNTTQGYTVRHGQTSAQLMLSLRL